MSPVGVSVGIPSALLHEEVPFDALDVWCSSCADRRRVRVLTLTGTPAAESLPGSDTLADVVRCGVRRLVVSGPLQLAGAPREALAQLAFLRDAQTEHLQVTWELIGSLPLDPEVVGHLPAPKVAEFEDSGVAAWRRRYRFGSLYWRNGGRFALIRDQRHGDVRRMRLEGDLLRMFLAAVEPLHLGNVAEAGLPATAGLVRAGLVLEHGGWLLALPIRLIRWPVPYDAIYA